MNDNQVEIRDLNFEILNFELWTFELSNFEFLTFRAAPYDGEDPYPSLSGYHDYEPQLEFDDSELLEQKPEEELGQRKIQPREIIFGHTRWRGFLK